MHVDLEDLAFERSGALLVKRALRLTAVGDAVTVAWPRPRSRGPSAGLVPRRGA